MPAPRIESSLLHSQKVSAADAHVIEANLSLFGPESDRTLHELVDLMRVNQENAAVHRSLAWAFLLRNDLGNAVEHIRRALALNDSDPAMHYLYARWVNQGEEDRIRIESAEARMGTELKAALKADPNYAAALELLGLAELSGGNTKAGTGNIFSAPRHCRPRSSHYDLNLARAYEAAGNLEAARNRMLYARAGGDAAVSGEAEELLNELGKQKPREATWEAMAVRPERSPTGRQQVRQSARGDCGGREGSGQEREPGGAAGPAKSRIHERPHRKRGVWITARCNPARQLRRAHLADACGQSQYDGSHRSGPLRLRLARRRRIDQLQATRKSPGRLGFAGSILKMKKALDGQGPT